MALSPMKLRKLQAVQPGTMIEITLSDNRSVAGSVMENDGESLDLLSDQYDEVFDYIEIINFRLLVNSGDSSSQREKKNNQNNDANPAFTLDLNELNTYLRKSTKPDFWTSTKIEKASDATLREYLNQIDERAIRQQAESILDQFLNAVHRLDVSRQSSAVTRLKQMVNSSADLIDNLDFMWFAANMMMRYARSEAVSTFEKGDFYYEAASCVADSDDDSCWEEVLRLVTHDFFSVRHDISVKERYTLLATAILKTGNATQLPAVVQRMSPADNAYLTSLVDYLAQPLADRSVITANNLIERAKQLAENYPSGLLQDSIDVGEGELYRYDQDTGIGEIFWEGYYYSFSLNMIRSSRLVDYLESLCRRDLNNDPIYVYIETRNNIPLGIEAIPEKEKLVPEEMIGEIYYLNWDAHTGLIRTEELSEISFRYDDIIDRKLNRKISEMLNNTIQQHPESVRFQLKKGKAVQIKPNQVAVGNSDSPEEVFRQAGRIKTDKNNPERFRMSNEMLRALFGTPLHERALENYMDNALAEYKRSNNLEVLQQAVQIYEANENRYPKNGHSLMTLLAIADHLGRTDLVRSGVDLLMSLPLDESAVPTHMSHLYKVIKSCQTAYNRTMDKSFLELCVKYTNEMESILVRYPELRSTHAASLAFNRFFCAVSSSDLEQAEQILSDAEKAGLTVIVTEDLQRAMDTLQASREAERQK